jgi:hypothetical protein
LRARACQDGEHGYDHLVEALSERRGGRLPRASDYV